MLYICQEQKRPVYELFTTCKPHFEMKHLLLQQTMGYFFSIGVQVDLEETKLFLHDYFDRGMHVI